MIDCRRNRLERTRRSPALAPSCTYLLALALAGLLLTAGLRAAGPGSAPHARPLRSVVGVTHVAGKYHLGDEDFLNEGADRILDLGSRVIKVWFEANPAKSYPYNSQWPEINNLVDLARTKYFSDLFDKPFSTYILMYFSVGRGAAYFRSGMTEDQKADEQEQARQLARYLLTRYEGTGKTFVLQHWEGDWLIRGNYDPKTEPTAEAVKGMIDWLAARQAGVTRARTELASDNVRVYCAAEVNRVVDSMKQGRPNLVNWVLPHVKMDLISYSAWDAATAHYEDPNVLRDALNFIAANAPDSTDFGDKNVYLGEYGMPASRYKPPEVRLGVQNAVQTALDWGCPYVVYWQLYCNELKDSKTPIPVKSNDLVRGFWLIRPDGSLTDTWHYFHDLLNQADPAPGPTAGGLPRTFSNRTE